MIFGYFHQGSGLGDQLMRYITVRTLAEKKGFVWGMAHPENFKGKDFMQIDMGTRLPRDPRDFEGYSSWNEKDVRDQYGNDIRSYDPEINFIEDNTVIDGGFEDYKYWGHNLDDIRSWLKVEPMHIPDDMCVVGFRGGEYASVPDLFLTKEYWKTAVDIMNQKHKITRFLVQTDDTVMASGFLGDIIPNATYLHEIGKNWRAVRFAKHLIIPNSAFYVIPALLNEHVGEVIAPRYWARRNTGIWSRPACFYDKFIYV